MDNLIVIGQVLYRAPLFYFFFGAIVLLAGAVIFSYFIQRAREEALQLKERNSLKNAKEAALAEVEALRTQFAAVKGELESRIKELELIDKFRRDLQEKDNQLKEELANKQLVLADFKALEQQYMTLKNELSLKEGELNNLKEEYEELKRYVEALKQALALEKNMHNRLKEEHANCQIAR